MCKSEVARGKSLDNLTEGIRVKLFGKWKISNNPKYKSMGEQFYFSDYEVLPSEDTESGSPAVDMPNPLAVSHTAQNQKEVTGYIVRFRPFTNNYRIFLLRSTDGSEFYCQGTIHQGKVPYENQKIRLSGNWRVNPHWPKFGAQFYFISYDIITPERPEKVIRRPRVTDQTKAPTTAEGGVAEQIVDYLKKIGEEKITYGSPLPKQGTVAWHVRQQLYDRVIRSTAEGKCFYFLTAFFDRHVPDSDVQLFRHTNRDFKEKLLRCWEEVKGELDVVISDIGRALADRKKLNLLFNESTTLRILADTLPGEYGIEQLLVCLKIIREKYDLNATCKIADLVPNMADEKALKQYLIGIHGVKHKIANWTLTNVTGHWFVIDDPNIKPLLKTDLADTIPAGIEVLAENADAIFAHWFGELNEKKKEYEKFSQAQFKVGFTDFPFEACEYLPFIVTQYLWFYGRRR